MADRKVMQGKLVAGVAPLTGSRGKTRRAASALLVTAMCAAPVAAYAQSAARSYNLPASALDQALTRFGNDAGILLSFDSALTAGKSTNGLRGSYTVPQGLAVLLAGTGLDAVTRPDGSFTLRRAAAASPTGPTGAAVLPAVTVTGATYGVARSELPAPYAGGQVARGAGAGVLGTRDLLDTPFSVTSYTEKTIKDQQAQSVADIVVNDASVRNVDPTNTGYANTFTVRGLILGNGSIALGGLFGLAPNNQTTLAGIERVEVMKGPTAFLNGMSPSGTAGAINLVPKRAGEEALTEFTASYLSDSQVGGHLDVGRRFGEDKQFGIRVNALYRDGDTSVDKQSQQLGSGSVGLDFRHERVRLSADAGYQKIDTDRANSTIAPQVGQAVPGSPSASKSFMSPWNFVDTTDYFGLMRGEFDITPANTVYASAGKSHTDWKQVLDFGTLLRNNGDFRSTTSMNYTGIDRTVAEVGWRGRVETGPVQHEFNVGANTYRAERTSVGTIGLGTIASNIYRPVFNPAPVIPSLDRKRSSDTVLSGVVLSDTLSVLDERAQLTLGVREQNISADNYSIVTGAKTSTYDKRKLTPVVGLVVKPVQNVALYGNYIEGLQQGTIVGAGYANAGEALAPFLSKQVEAGVKIDSGVVSTTVSVFQITQAAGIANTATNTFSSSGEQRNRGIELNVVGEPVRGVRLLGGVLLLDADLTKTANGLYNGRTAPGTARTNLTIGAEWDTPFVPGLTLTSRVIHTGKQYVDAANTQTLKSWATVDVGARYTLRGPGGNPMVLRASLRNVFGENYWMTYPGAGTLNRSEGRTVLLSATMGF